MKKNNLVSFKDYIKETFNKKEIKLFFHNIFIFPRSFFISINYKFSVLWISMTEEWKLGKNYKIVDEKIVREKSRNVNGK